MLINHVLSTKWSVISCGYELLQVHESGPHHSHRQSDQPYFDVTSISKVRDISAEEITLRGSGLKGFSLFGYGTTKKSGWFLWENIEWCMLVDAKWILSAHISYWFECTFHNGRKRRYDMDHRFWWFPIFRFTPFKGPELFFFYFPLTKVSLRY